MNNGTLHSKQKPLQIDKELEGYEAQASERFYPYPKDKIEKSNLNQAFRNSRKNFCELFREITRLCPEAIATRYYERLLSYSELDELSDSFAFKLIQHGIGPKDIVGVGLYNDLDVIVAMLGILKAGAVYLPIEPNYSLKRIYQMSVGVDLIITNSNSSAIFSNMPSNLLEIDLDKLEYSKVNLPKIAPNQPAYIIYTSGTAGMPKGITISHHSLLYAAKSFASLFPYPSCALMSSSISFDPSILTIIHALSTGGSVCLYENMKNTINYNEVTSLITRYKVNFIISTPSYYQQLLTESKSKKLDSLQNVIMCGENIPPKLIQDHQHIANKANLYNAYGPSEYAIGTTIGIIYDSSSKIQFSENIGVPFCKNKLYVLDEQLQHVPIGKKGEFYISGPGLAIGYYQQDSLTKERFFNHQIGNEQVTLYRTGDVGYQRHDGNFVFCERKNFHVKSNQNKVEKILNSCEAEEYKKLNRNTRATIIKQAPSHIGREKHDFEYFATVNTKPYAFRKSAQDYVKGLESDQSRRFKYLFDNVANHVAFQSRYILGLFKPDSSTSTLLDIGCGPGIIAKPLLPYYKQITGVDCDSHLIPVLSSLERKKNFSFVSGKFQDIIFGERYDHILCNHSIYYIPKRTWERSIKKMLSLLKDEGSILLVQTAPLGPIHDLREPISSEYPHSGHMHKLLQKMGIKYSTDVLVLQHPQPSRKAFKELIHMYMIDGCYPPDGYSTSPDYNNLTEMEKERLDNLVEGFVSGCYDYTKNAYVLHDVCHYIKIEKQ